MRNYETQIQVRGLRRADPARAREPIPAGEVIALPDTVARDLLRHGAIVETEDEPTVELTFDAPKTLVISGGIAADDRAALATAIGELGGVVLFPEESDSYRDGLAAVIVDMGGVVMFPEADGSFGLSSLPGPALVAAVIEQVERHIIEPTDLSAKLPEDLILKEVAFRLQVGTLDAANVRALLPADAPPAAPPADPPEQASGKPAAPRKKA